MIHSSKQLKDLIRNLSKEVGIEAHVLIRKLERTITEISNIDLDDNVKFRIKKVSEIMDEAEYSGIRKNRN